MSNVLFVFLVLTNLLWAFVVYILVRYNRACNAELRVLAYSNPITQLPNRRAFDRSMIQLRTQQEQGRVHVFSVAYLDLDGFKEVNDRLGHAVGDQVLQVVGALLRTMLCSTDIKLHIGGDEFLLFFPGMGEADAVRKLCEIRKKLPRMLEEESINANVSFSFGVASSPPCDHAELVELAELNMYRWKETRSARR